MRPILLARRGDLSVRPSTPPPAPIIWEGPATFSDANVPVGGLTVTGHNFESSSTRPGIGPYNSVIRILTARPITFVNCRFRALTGTGISDYMIDAYHDTPYGTDITIRNCRVYGPTDRYVSPRWFVGTNFKRLEISNCTIENTRGIELWEGTYPSAICIITKNIHNNILGAATELGLGAVGNFVQMRVMRNTYFTITWNQIVNEYDKSEPEDIISVYHTANGVFSDNMLWHQSQPGNVPLASMSGFTADSSDAGLGCDNWTVERNQVVDGMGIFFSLQSGGSNNQINNNRIIGWQYLPDGTTLKRNGYSGFDVLVGGANNHAVGNLVGYYGVDHKHTPTLADDTWQRNDGSLAGTVEGWAANTHLGHDPTQADIDAEWTFWQNKLSANSITVGSSLPSSTTYIFQEEFDYTGPPDPAKWFVSHGLSTAPDDAYTAFNRDNAYVSGGYLHLRISQGTQGRPYDGVLMDTFIPPWPWPPSTVYWQADPPFRAEARIKFTPGAGTWQGFWWMANRDSPTNLELDVQEYRGNKPLEVTCHTHVTTEYGNMVNVGWDGAADFHIYWMEYRVGSVIFGVDSTETGRTNLNSSPPEMIRLNAVVGVPGTWGGENGPPPSNVIPGEMLVDWIRVWRI